MPLTLFTQFTRQCFFRQFQQQQIASYMSSFSSGRKKWCTGHLRYQTSCFYSVLLVHCVASTYQTRLHGLNAAADLFDPKSPYLASGHGPDRTTDSRQPLRKFGRKRGSPWIQSARFEDIKRLSTTCQLTSTLVWQHRLCSAVCQLHGPCMDGGKPGSLWCLVDGLSVTACKSHTIKSAVR